MWDEEGIARVDDDDTQQRGWRPAVLRYEIWRPKGQQFLASAQAFEFAAILGAGCETENSPSFEAQTLRAADRIFLEQA